MTKAKGLFYGVKMKIPEHIQEKITGPEEHYKKGFIDGWNSRETGIQKESDFLIEDILKREGDLRKEIAELKAQHALSKLETTGE